MLDISSRPAAPALPPDFLVGGGEMGERMRAFDWTRTHLGPARDWPQGLKIALRIVLASPQPMCILWGGAHTLLFNDACRAVLGDGHAALLARPASSEWTEFWLAAAHRVELAQQRNEGSCMDALRLSAERAGRREISSYGVVFTPLPGDPGAAGGVLCMFTDTGAALRNERIYRAIGESLDYGVWTANRLGRATYISESFLKLVGCTHTEWASAWQRHVHPDDVTGLQEAWDACVHDGRVFDREFRVRGPGRKWYSILGRAVPMHDEHGEVCGFAGIHLDIQRLKQVEHELRELDQRKNEFLATLAHELRNPLAPLRNGVEVLRIARDDHAMAEKARTMMERQLRQMVRLVDDLLDVSRVSRGKIELRRDNVELSAVLRNAIETSQPLMTERGHELVARIPDEKIVVYADMTRMSQVFWNLLNNAAKYTEAGGRIELAVEMREEAVAVTVRDNGIGIPANMLARVFDIFTQVDRSLEKAQGGLGIGLSIARRLVEMHGGAIEAKSEGHGRGSAFTVTLPAAIVPRAAEIPAGAAAPAGINRMACKRILIADDNADSATTLSIMLEMLGNDVRVAHDGEAAVHAAREFRPDAILLDIGMPKMNGYDACSRLRSFPETASAYMVALTGWGQEEDRNRARAAGFDHHLVKPVEPALLEKLISELPARH